MFYSETNVFFHAFFVKKQFFFAFFWGHFWEIPSVGYFLTLQCDCNGNEPLNGFTRINEPLNGFKSIATIFFSFFFLKPVFQPIFSIKKYDFPSFPSFFICFWHFCCRTSLSSTMGFDRPVVVAFFVGLLLRSSAYPRLSVDHLEGSGPSPGGDLRLWIAFSLVLLFNSLTNGFDVQ